MAGWSQRGFRRLGSRRRCWPQAAAAQGCQHTACEGLDTERRCHPVPRLTTRQWELLRLVAAGHTNGQVARRLDVSEGTVRIHLQNIYARLQVSSRTAAVTRAFPELAAR